MADYKHGSVTVVLPASVTVPEKAGKLTSEEVARTEKARRGVGLVCATSAAAIRANPQRISVMGLTADELEAAGKAAEDIDPIINDLEVALATLKQGNLLLDAAANQGLRRVLAAVRAAEKFDATVADLFPNLIEYFSSERAPEPQPEVKK